MENYDDLAINLISILSRVNMLINYLPNSLQESMESAVIDIKSVLKKLGYLVSLADSNDYMHSFNDVQIYDELINVEKQLSLCMLKLPNYSSLEDAYFDIRIVVNGLTDRNSSVKEHIKKKALMLDKEC